jgi:hypothetical protein
LAKLIKSTFEVSNLRGLKKTSKVLGLELKPSRSEKDLEGLGLELNPSRSKKDLKGWGRNLCGLQDLEGLGQMM